MSIVNPAIAACMGSGSAIRRAYELGVALRAKDPNAEVFDFSLGNPHLEPPVDLVDRLRELATSPEPGVHRYMTTAGFPAVRKRMAEAVAKREGVAIPAENVLMTCGAAGALNVAFRTLLSPGDEVVFIAPCFVEYPYYALHAYAEPKIAKMRPDFDINVSAVADSITSRTRVVVVNSPNNPTGRVYPKETLAALADLLADRSRKYGRPIVLISDDPYRRIVYDDVSPPPVFPLYPATVLCTSFSKDLGLAGERIGFLALNADFPEAKDVMAGMLFCMRTLGFVNAPALMQRLVADVLDASVEVDAYRRNRDLLCDGLTEIGYRLRKPDGAFFAFPEAPGGDDVKFIDRLAQERILAVPGVGFEAPGYFRLSFAVPEEQIVRSIPGFKRAFEAVGGF